MRKALVIGGTRNLGPGIVAALMEEGFAVSVFHRGKTHAELPAAVERLHGDRRDPAQLQAALGGRDFDFVVDTALYTGPEATAVSELLEGRTGQFVMLSTGQVYLVREDVFRPFREVDYDGPTTAAPSDAYDREEWAYGMNKRAAEDALFQAHRERAFPVTVLRLPMVNSERDHFERIFGYMARLLDGGPVLIPTGPHLDLRHVYGVDVVHAIRLLATSRAGIGTAYNLSQDETISLPAFLKMLASFCGGQLRMVRVPREQLKAEGLLPGCSPFSDAWMSALENVKSKAELGMRYTPLSTYLPRIAEHYLSQAGRIPAGYEQRALELRHAM